MKLHVLLVDNRNDDRALVREELTRHLPDVEVTEVTDPEALARAFERERVDLVISDYALGWANGLTVLTSASKRWAGCGTIMYTRTGSEEIAVAAMKAGVDDYLAKSRRHLSQLPEVIRQALDRHSRIDPESPPSPLLLLQRLTEIANGSETLFGAMERILPELSAGTGWPVAHAWKSVPGKRGYVESSGIWFLLDPARFETFRHLTTSTRLHQGQGIPGRAAKEGAAVWIQDMRRAIDSPRVTAAARVGIGAAVAVPIHVDDETVAVLELFHRGPKDRDDGMLALMDRVAFQLERLAARERAEEQRTELRDRVMASRRIEAIGRLAGGVAHDFNNLLSVVTLEAEDALGETHLPLGVRRSLGTILKTAERAGGLTRHLLTLGRRAPSSGTIVDVSQMLSEMRPLLGGLAGPRVKLLIQVDPKAPCVKADRGQLEQVMVNLVENARDATPPGGEIEVSVRRGSGAGNLDAPPEQPTDRLLIAVSDTGRGIPPAIRDRIFEPFVSTKAHGAGTGLGLAVCHSVVTELGGRIRVEDRDGGGTTFEISLPTEPASETGAAAPALPERASERRGSILLVQDEEDLCRVLARLLGAHGYDVVPVGRGEDAMEILEAGRHRFDVVVADVGLPGIQGPELAQRAGSLLPGAALILTTGYTELTSSPGKAAELGVDEILGKPFTVDQLLSRIRQIRERRASQESRAS